MAVGSTKWNERKSKLFESVIRREPEIRFVQFADKS